MKQNITRRAGHSGLFRRELRKSRSRGAREGVGTAEPGMARHVALARVDDRLLSGELVTAWLPAVEASRIAVVDDAAARDPFQKRLLTALGPQGVPVQVYTVEEAARMMRAKGTPEERLLLLAKTPLTFARLRQQGIPLRDAVLGGTGPRGARRHILDGVWLDSEEMTACRELLRAGCRIRYQRIPEGRSVDMAAVLNRSEATAQV